MSSDARKVLDEYNNLSATYVTIVDADRLAFALEETLDEITTLRADIDGIVYRHPVRVEYREGPEDDVLRHARGMCRACEMVWRGGHELRSLRWQIDEPKAVGE